MSREMNEQEILQWLRLNEVPGVIVTGKSSVKLSPEQQKRDDEFVAAVKNIKPKPWPPEVVRYVKRMQAEIKRDAESK